MKNLLSNTNSRRNSKQHDETLVKPSRRNCHHYNNDIQSSSSCNNSPINSSSSFYKSKFWKFRKSTVQMLLIGLCLGVTFGIFIPILDFDDIDCNSILENQQKREQQQGSLPSSSIYFNNNNKLPYAQKQQQGSGIQKIRLDQSKSSSIYNRNNSNKAGIVPDESVVEKMKRPRYFSTELGLRNKIIVGVILSDTNYIDNILAINETLSTSHIDKLLFFIGGTESSNIVTKLKTLGVLGVIEVQDLNNNNNNNNSKLGETLMYNKGVKNTRDSSSTISNTKKNTSSSSNNFNYNKILLLKVIKYFGERFGETYNYFFLSFDNYYINGRHLVNSVSQISISQDIIWGIPSSTFSCSLEKGFVLSRRIVQKLSTKIDRCISNPSLNNVGKCIYFLLNGKYTCTNSVDGINYSSIPVNSSSQKLTSALTIGPVNSSSDMLKVHGKIFESRLNEIQETILDLQNRILNLHPKIPIKHQKLTWPIGIPSGTLPKSRFDVLKWNYFDQNYIYGTSEITSLKKLDGVEKKDLNHIINSATKLFEQEQSSSTTIFDNNNKLRKDAFSSDFQLQFHHGYRRFNPTRGMEYILDFQNKKQQKNRNTELNSKNDNNIDGHHNFIRIEGVRPVCKMEVISMPFVTDNHRTVTIILPVTTENVQQVHKFLDRFFDFSTDQKMHSVLIIALIIKKSFLTTMSTIKNKNVIKTNLDGNNLLKNSSSFPSSSSLTQDQIQEIKTLISYYNRKIPRALSDSMKAGYIIIPTTATTKTTFVTSPTTFLSTIDGVIKRIVGTSSLILTVDINVNIKDEFLNRVRMNTIMNRQVFAPIPFIEHNPSVYRDKKKVQGGNSVPELEISRNSGYFDQNIFRYFSFFAADYVAVRKSVNLKELETFSDFSVLEHVFLQNSSLHILRSPEPALKIPFSFGLFSKSPTECSSLEDCTKTNWGTRGQLAKIIFSFLNPHQHNTILKNKT